MTRQTEILGSDEGELSASPLIAAVERALWNSNFRLLTVLESEEPGAIWNRQLQDILPVGDDGAGQHIGKVPGCRVERECFLRHEVGGPNRPGQGKDFVGAVYCQGW